ncbi:MAG: DUF120 domain-containing protein [Candidatus Altiarchaeota archaeon]|nr:DUF120 domain-containing protein [Candidatus Altiarchaeota archaeon]
MIDRRLLLFELSRMLDSTDATTTISSANLGAVAGVSQQTASRYLARLEREGLITRLVRKRGQELALTPEGISLLGGMHRDLGLFLEGKKGIRLAGKISTGIGEGAYYIRTYADRIQQALGFRPFYGTLNVSVENIPSGLARFVYATVRPFEKDGRSFGLLRLIKVRLSAGKRKADCYLALPERTHHKNELELISPLNLRKEMGIKNASPVTVELLPKE